jgi:hypothetical protein
MRFDRDGDALIKFTGRAGLWCGRVVELEVVSAAAAEAEAIARAHLQSSGGGSASAGASASAGSRAGAGGFAIGDIVRVLDSVENPRYGTGRILVL